MKKRFCLICCLAILYLYSFSQVKSKTLVIYSITEYIDGYVIKAIDTAKSDTFNIVSVKETFKCKPGFEKMIVGRAYNFEFEDLISKMSAVPPDNFAARIKTTVIWRAGDGMSSAPVYATNTKSLWIKKN